MSHIERIESFRKLEPGWNYPGDQPPSEIAITNGKNISKLLSRVGVDAFPCPTPDGSVFFEFKHGTTYTMIECHEGGEITVLGGDEPD